MRCRKNDRASAAIICPSTFALRVRPSLVRHQHHHHHHHHRSITPSRSLALRSLVDDPACPNSEAAAKAREISPRDRCASQSASQPAVATNPDADRGRWRWWHSLFLSGGDCERGKSNPLCPRGTSTLPTDVYGYMARLASRRCSPISSGYILSQQLKPHTWRELPSSESPPWLLGSEGGRSCAPVCLRTCSGFRYAISS